MSDIASLCLRPIDVTERLDLLPRWCQFSGKFRPRDENGTPLPWPEVTCG